MNHKPWNDGTQARIEDTEDGRYKIVGSNEDAYFINMLEKETLPDGTVVDPFHREMQYADGEVIDMGTASADHNISLFNLDWVNDMLKKAGLQNISIKADYLSKDDTEIMYAIVAKKPQR